MGAQKRVLSFELCIEVFERRLEAAVAQDIDIYCFWASHASCVDGCVPLAWHDRKGQVLTIVALFKEVTPDLGMEGSESSEAQDFCGSTSFLGAFDFASAM